MSTNPHDRFIDLRTACTTGNFRQVKYLCELHQYDSQFPIINGNFINDECFKLAYDKRHYKIVRYLLTLYRNHGVNGKYKPIKCYTYSSVYYFSLTDGSNLPKKTQPPVNNHFSPVGPQIQLVAYGASDMYLTLPTPVRINSNNNLLTKFQKTHHKRPNQPKHMFRHAW